MSAAELSQIVSFSVGAMTALAFAIAAALRW